MVYLKTFEDITYCYKNGVEIKIGDVYKMQFNKNRFAIMQVVIKDETMFNLTGYYFNKYYKNPQPAKVTYQDFSIDDDNIPSDFDIDIYLKLFAEDNTDADIEEMRDKITKRRNEISHIIKVHNSTKQFDM